MVTKDERNKENFEWIMLKKRVDELERKLKLIGESLKDLRTKTKYEDWDLEMELQK